MRTAKFLGALGFYVGHIRTKLHGLPPISQIVLIIAEGLNPVNLISDKGPSLG